MPSHTGITVTYGHPTEKLVHVYPEHAYSNYSSTSGSRQSSGASRSDQSWSDPGEDPITPSDSASHPRSRPSRRPIIEVPEVPPLRRDPSRRSRPPAADEAPRSRRDSVRYHTGRRDTLSEREPAPRAASRSSHHSVAYPDEYVQGRPSSSRPPPGHRASMSNYPPSDFSQGHYYPQHAMTPYDTRDGYGYRDAFAPQPAGNPFAQPASLDGRGNGYYSDGAPMAPPPPPQAPPQQRPPPAPRPQSYGPGYEAQLIAPYHHYPQQMPYPPYGYPAVPGYWPPPQISPPAPAPAPAPAAEKPPSKSEPDPALGKIQEMLAAQLNNAQKKEVVKNEEVESLKAALAQIKAQADLQRKEWEAEKAKERAAKAEAERKAAEDAKKKEEIAAASKKAKEDAESKAAEAAKKAKEEAEKKLAEVEKAKVEAEAKKKELEETVKKITPESDTLKAPIRFKDAVGRKFSFPWTICKTWKGMDGLIKQAFQHVDKIGDHVHQGHFDLTGPDGQIILPQVWDSMVQPDWEITMHLWPMPEEKKPAPAPAPKKDDLMDILNGSGGGLFGPPGGRGMGAGGSAAAAQMAAMEQQMRRHGIDPRSQAAAQARAAHHMGGAGPKPHGGIPVPPMGPMGVGDPLAAFRGGGGGGGGGDLLAHLGGLGGMPGHHPAAVEVLKGGGSKGGAKKSSSSSGGKKKDSGGWLNAMFGPAPAPPKKKKSTAKR